MSVCSCKHERDTMYDLCVIYFEVSDHGLDKELMQSAHPSPRDCFAVSTGLAGLDGNTRSARYKKTGQTTERK